jgi:glycogen operon protein
MPLPLSRGQPYPIGATVQPGGVNFCVFSKNATAIELLLFDSADGARPAHVIQLDPERHRTFYYWHVFAHGLGAGQLYGYRVHGPFAPERGRRFDGSKVLVDPYARAVMYGEDYSREAAQRFGVDNIAHCIKSVVVDTAHYDWEGDTPLGRPYSGSVIYEMHVAGFTRHPSSGVAPEKRGTFAGLVEKIPYLKELGVTAVELLPVQQFDEQDAPKNTGLKNYWGYTSLAFFAPHRGYAARPDALGPVDEFRDMVKALHRAGLEVILDVVFNHTTENDEEGPTLSFRGFENRMYYHLDPHNPAKYANFSGCGNALNGNHALVRRFILDCLRYWVQEMHVDGFRFDLASVLARDEAGHPHPNPPVLWEIEADPVLAGTKIIAEAWDAAGLYQVGNFIGHRWAEWNSHFRDDVRRFVKGDSGVAQALAARLTGSPDLYPQPDREPNRSINFITCHDGFTLNDLASYNEKHNAANGEGNRDGNPLNWSWNCGVEGPTDDPAIEALRQRQIKNFLTLLFIAQGTPMLAMGDEVRRTQHGNNNAYCQDNDLSWFDWRAVEQQAGLLRFVRGLIRFTQARTLFEEERFWTANGNAQITWHGVHLNQPDWGHDSHSLVFSLSNPEAKEHLHVIVNAYWEPLAFDLPLLPAGQLWRRAVDTAQPAPADFAEPGAAPIVTASRYPAQPRSAVILLAR